jgi:hypothetical protein
MTNYPQHADALDDEFGIRTTLPPCAAGSAGGTPIWTSILPPSSMIEESAAGVSVVSMTRSLTRMTASLSTRPSATEVMNVGHGSTPAVP